MHDCRSCARREQRSRARLPGRLTCAGCVSVEFDGLDSFDNGIHDHFGWLQVPEHSGVAWVKVKVSRVSHSAHMENNRYTIVDVFIGSLLAYRLRRSDKQSSEAWSIRRGMFKEPSWYMKLLTGF